MPGRRSTGGGRWRRSSQGKAVPKGRRPKAKGVKPAAGKARAVAPPGGTKVGARAAAKAPPARITPVVPKAVSAVEKRKEGPMADTKQLTPDQFLATVLVPEFSRDTGHMCWDCKHFKPVLKGSKFPPADTIGWCAQIHWPFFWCVTDFNVVKKCYAFEKGVYAPYQPARFK